MKKTKQMCGGGRIRTRYLSHKADQLVLKQKIKA